MKRSVYRGVIYCLINPKTKKVFYVGITIKNLSDRLKQHLRYPCNPKIAKYLGRMSEPPEIKELEVCTNYRNSSNREIFWINKFHSEGIKLYNANLKGTPIKKLANLRRK